MRVLTARGSELEREFPFGVVRQLFEARAGRPAELRERAWPARRPAPRARARALGDERGEAAPTPSFAALHGLYWLALNLAAERPLVLAIDDLQWCDRPSLRFVAYLVRRLEGLPMLVAATVRTGEPARRRGAARRDRARPADGRRPAGPLSDERRAGARAERLGADPTAAFADACHRATGGNPLLLRQLLTALEADGVQPTPRTPGSCVDIGPRAVSRTVLLRLARLPGRRGGGRPRRGRARRGRRPAGRRRADGSRRGRRRGGHGRARARRDPAPGAAARLRPPARARGGLPRAAARRARAAPRARGAVLRERGRAGRAGRRAAARDAAPRRGVGRARRCTTRPAARPRTGAPESAVAYLRRALEEPPAPSSAAARAARARRGGGADRRPPAAAEHLREAYERSRTRCRGRSRPTCWRARCCSSRADAAERRAFARRAPRRYRRAGATSAAQLEAVELMPRYFDAGEPCGARGELEPLSRERRAGRRRRRGCSPAWRPGDWANAAAGRGPVRELALAALADGVPHRSRQRPASRWAPLVVLAARRPPGDARLLGAGARRRAPQRLAVRTSAIHLWRGFTLLLRGDLRRGRGVAAAAIEGSPPGATPTRPPYSPRSWRRRPRDAGDVAGARAGARPAVGPRSAATARPSGARALIELLLAEAPRRPWPPLASGALHRRSQPGLVPVARAGGRGAHAPRPAGRGRSRWPRGARGRRALGRAADARPRAAGLGGAPAARTASPHLEEAIAVARGRRPARAGPSAHAALGGRCAGRGGRPTRASRCAARSSSPTPAAPRRSSSTCAASSTRPARGRARRALSGVEALTASERRVVELAADGRATATSPRPCS